MNKRIVILTKSSKYRNLCVAGIDYETGEWIRLVSTDEATHGAINPLQLLCDNGRLANLLDVIDVEVTGNENNPIQPENYILARGHRVKYVESITINEAVDLYKGQDEKLIFGNTMYYVDEDSVSSLGRSLALVEARDLQFEKLVNDEGKSKVKVSFVCNGNGYSSIAVTDQRFYNVPNEHKLGHAIIVVSIGTPHNGKYYKFAAAIYSLDQP